jgi:tetratricopeptide (TPR) repeat protein
MCGDDEELKEEETNYYKENIFNKEDYYLYRAVMYFYAGEYEKSICDFEQSSSIMHSSKVLYPRNQFPDDEDLDDNADNLSQASSQTDLSDVGLCSLNIHEYSFNTILNLIQMKEYKKSLTKLDYILDTIPKKYAS